ncbi:MAG: type II toxin-antitoxin system VapC family toxin [Deltaproteobacteria bacterium]|nr:type II toxin-antitoxin system VapC family toxin [Deltaproteobacteria bacterium]
MTEEKTFVDTDILIDVARKDSRALDFWRRAEAKSGMVCSVISVFEILAGCRTMAEQRAILRSLSALDIAQVESGDSVQALEWYRRFHLARGVGFLDCFVAAAANRLKCSVHTLNTRHFRAIPGLQVRRPY